MTWGTPNRVTTSSTIILATVPVMAYRATAHETTGFSPNMLMLGRETSTPLDLVYDMPPGIKPVPANMWVSTSYKTSESFPKMLNGPLQNDVNFGVHPFFFWGKNP
jgi:hypothetical protein